MRKNFRPYINIAINELNDLPYREASIQNISEQIKELQSKMDGIGSAAADKSPVKGGASAYEKSLIERIVKLDKLKESLVFNKRFVKRVNNALSMLSNQEATVLWLFYVDRPSRHIDVLCERLNVEQSKLYDIKDEALRKYIMIMYGK